MLVRVRLCFFGHCWLQTFFRITSDRMCLSSVRPATRRLSRAFSSRSCRISRISLTPSCPYFFFQTYNVASDTPIYSHLPTHIAHRRPTLGPAQRVCDLFLAELRFLHGPLPLAKDRRRQLSSTYELPYLSGLTSQDVPPGRGL